MWILLKLPAMLSDQFPQFLPRRHCVPIDVCNHPSEHVAVQSSRTHLVSSLLPQLGFFQIKVVAKVLPSLEILVTWVVASW